MAENANGGGASLPQNPVDISHTGRVDDYRKSELVRPAFALKTNLLFDAAITPNIEVERWFGRSARFSLMAEAWMPWWSNSDDSKVYELFNAGLEWRVWMHHDNGYYRRPLTGHFLGLYGSGGYYDLQHTDNGHRGEFYSAGLTYGYACRIARRFNLEFSVSAGYVGGPYKSYHPMPGTDYLVLNHSDHLNYWGPTKAKISLVWLIGGR